MLGIFCFVINEYRLTEECNVVVKSEELIGTAEYVTVQVRCRINRCSSTEFGCISKKPAPTS